jgi:hypothetical protein
MPLQTKPQDEPAAVCFHIEPRDHGIEVSVSLLPQQPDPPYRIGGPPARFESHDAFRGRAIWVGLTPAVDEDGGRSFNVTARQLRELGFQAELTPEKQKKEEEIDRKRNREESVA